VVAGALVLRPAQLLREFSEFRYFVFGAVLATMMLYKPEDLA
jgi:ABC-type branched-subunit amino acid transport system permease subunit